MLGLVMSNYLIAENIPQSAYYSVLLLSRTIF
jgi:hypothetical protein